MKLACAMHLLLLLFLYCSRASLNNTAPTPPPSPVFPTNVPPCAAESSALLPECSTGSVRCVDPEWMNVSCSVGSSCPNGTLFLPLVTHTGCPASQQMLIAGSQYRCVTNDCTRQVTEVGYLRCDVPPLATCSIDQKVCIWDKGNAAACQDAESECWPGTHEWTQCKAELDFKQNMIKLENSHFIKCFSGLRKNPDKSLTCRHPFFDTLTIPESYLSSKVLYMKYCDGSDSSVDWLLPISLRLGFKSIQVSHYWWTDPIKRYDIPLYISDSWYASFRGIVDEWPEFCYFDGSLHPWKHCNVDDSNGNCMVTDLRFLP